MQLANGVEVLQYTPENDRYLEFNAVAADTWAAGDYLYWDSGSSTVKKYAPADTTAAASLQAKIFGIASKGKLAGDTRVGVMVKAQVLMDATNPLVGAACVVKYNATTKHYTAYEGGQYNTDFDPDITLSLDFLTFVTSAVETDNRAVLQIDGTARLLSFN